MSSSDVPHRSCDTPNGVGGSVAFGTAPENSIEVYDDKFGRKTILTRSARMRKFKFYQYKPIQDSTNGSSPQILKTPTILPRDEVLQGKVSLVAEQSKELVELDKEIAGLEKKISDLTNATGNRDHVKSLDEIFSLVHKKNDLLRRQMQLNIIEQEKVLERANEELTKELRSLMIIEDSQKSEAQLERQQYLYDQSLALVNKRNELVHHMDVQEKGIEDDNAMKATLKSVISDVSTRNQINNPNSSHDQNCIIQ